MKTIKKIKVLTVIGTRPEIIRLSEVMKALDYYTEHVVVHTGQNYDYELSEVFFKDLGLRKPDYFLEAAGDTPAKTVGAIIGKVDDVYEKEKPDAVLILGDTNSALAGYPAKRRKIPIFHMEAGNRSFDQRVPEEINRKIIDHLSDINMVYSDNSRTYLLREGLPPERVIKTGSPLCEVLLAHKREIEKSKVLTKLKLKKGDYFVLSAHREENVDNEEQFKNLVETINNIVKSYNKRIIFSAHPRTRKRFEGQKIVLPKQVEMMKPLGFFDYVNLEKNALCVISDSGTISEESSILHFKAVNIREAHERPEAMDEGAVILAGLNSERVLQAIEATLKSDVKHFETPEAYTHTNVSQKVVRIIMSHIDYVNHFVWHK